MPAKLTTEEFILKAACIHEWKCNYRLVNYINNNKKVKIICNMCGCVFEKIPRDHLDSTGYCPTCARKFKPKPIKYTDIEKIDFVDSIGYKFIRFTDDKHKRMLVKCDKEHEYDVFFGKLKTGRRCKLCSFQRRTKTTEQFIIEAIKIHCWDYGYSRSVYNLCASYIEIQCLRCKDYFWQEASIHLQGYGCKYCNNKKYTDQDVINLATTLGYVFIKFVDKKHRRLLVRCANNHEFEIEYSTLHKYSNKKAKYQCKQCFYERLPDITEIAEMFSVSGCVLLSTSIENSKSKLHYICSKKHLCVTTWNNFQQDGITCSNCADIGMTGKNNESWKGGVSKLNLPLYETFAHRLSPYQEVFLIKQVVNGEVLELLGVNCHYDSCTNNVFVPTAKAVSHRISAINTGKKALHLFCSEQCKKDCSSYGQVKYPKDFKPTNKNYRTHQTEWANLVKANANHTCEICGANKNVKLIGHHEVPVIVNEMLSADIDNGICVCEFCHNKIHQIPWCTLSYLRSCSLRKKNE